MAQYFHNLRSAGGGFYVTLGNCEIFHSGILVSCTPTQIVWDCGDFRRTQRNDGSYAGMDEPSADKRMRDAAEKAQEEAVEACKAVINKAQEDAQARENRQRDKRIAREVISDFKTTKPSKDEDTYKDWTNPISFIIAQIGIVGCIWNLFIWVIELFDSHDDPTSHPLAWFAVFFVVMCIGSGTGYRPPPPPPPPPPPGTPPPPEPEYDLFTDLDEVARIQAMFAENDKKRKQEEKAKKAKEKKEKKDKKLVSK